MRVSCEGFTTIGGTLTEFYASGTDATLAYAINCSDEVVGLVSRFQQCRTRLLSERQRNHQRDRLPGRDRDPVHWD